MDQETINALRSKEITKQRIDEFQGILYGVLADDVLLHSEVDFVVQWLETNRDLRLEWPLCAVREAIVLALEDGVLDQGEIEGLKDLFRRIVPPLTGEVGAQIPAAPWDDDEFVTLEGSKIVISGEFILSHTEGVKDILRIFGAKPMTNVSKKTDYLIVGSIGNEAWKHGRFGTKISTATRIRNEGGKIRIVTEEALHNTLVDLGAI